MIGIGPFRLNFKHLSKSFSETKDELGRRVAMNPNDIAAMVRYAQALEADHDSDTAEELFEKVLDREPDNPEALEFFIEHGSDHNERLRLYYRLERISPNAAADCAASGVYALLDRASGEVTERNIEALETTLREAHRIASKLPADEVSSSLLRYEVCLAAGQGNVALAQSEIKRLARLEKWTDPGLEWRRDALVRELAKLLGSQFDEKMQLALFGQATEDKTTEQKGALRRSSAT